METAKKQGSADKLLAQVIKLIDLVDYQEGSVVSSTVIDKKVNEAAIIARDTSGCLSSIQGGRQGND